MGLYRNLISFISIIFLLLLLYFCNFNSVIYSKLILPLKFIKICSNYVDSKIYNKFQNINIITDIFLLQLNTKGGNINGIKYLFKNKLNYLNKFMYKFQNNILINQNSIYVKPLFNSNKDVYILKKNENELHIPLIYISFDNIIYIKTFIFKRGEYNFSINYHIINNNNKFLKLLMF